MTWGPRFAGGYQMPRTNAASATRGRPLEEHGPFGAQIVYVKVIPLEGLRERTWSVEATWGGPGQDGGAHMVLVHREEEARGTVENMLAYTRGGGRWPVPAELEEHWAAIAAGRPG